MNKRLIIVIMTFLSIIVLGQKDNSDGPRKYPAVEVKLNAVVALTDSKGNDLDKDLIMMISQLKALQTINYSYSAHKKAHELKTVLYFSDMKEFFKWYESEETKILIEALENKFKRYNIMLSYKKAAEL